MQTLPRTFSTVSFGDTWGSGATIRRSTGTRSAGLIYPRRREEQMHARPSTVDDATRAMSESVVSSSRGRSWTGLEVMRARLGFNDMEVPALASHTVVVNLGLPYELTGELEGKTRRETMVTGGTKVVSAGVESGWRWTAGGALDAGGSAVRRASQPIRVGYLAEQRGVGEEAVEVIVPAGRQASPGAVVADGEGVPDLVARRHAPGAVVVGVELELLGEIGQGRNAERWWRLRLGQRRNRQQSQRYE